MFKRKKVVQFVTNNKSVYERAPIVPAKGKQPTWWRKLPPFRDFNPLKYGYKSDSGFISHLNKSVKNQYTQTAKVCPGISGAIKSGFIVPMWCDVDFYYNHENNFFNFELASNRFECSIQSSYNSLEGTPIAQKEKQFLVKLTGPWAAILPKNYEMLMIPPLYRKPIPNIEVAAGVQRNDKWRKMAFINAFVTLDFSDGRSHIRLPFGEPLYQLFIYDTKDSEMKHTTKLVGPDTLAQDGTGDYTRLKITKDWI